MVIMDIVRHTLLVVNLNDIDRKEVTSISDVRAIVFAAKELEVGSLWVSADGGSRPWWHRLLGANRWVIPYFSLAWSGDAAVLTFLDEDASEYKAADRDGPSYHKDESRLRSAHPDRQGPIVSKARAFEAVQAFL